MAFHVHVRSRRTKKGGEDVQKIGKHMKKGKIWKMKAKMERKKRGG
jgi:hypothetical protein